MLSRAELISCSCSRRSVRKAKVPMPKIRRQMEMDDDPGCEALEQSAPLDSTRRLRRSSSRSGPSAGIPTGSTGATVSSDRLNWCDVPPAGAPVGPARAPGCSLHYRRPGRQGRGVRLPRGDNGGL